MNTPVEAYDALVEEWRQDPKKIEPAIHAALTLSQETRIPILETELDTAHKELVRANTELAILSQQYDALGDQIEQYRAVAEQERAARRQLEDERSEPDPIEPPALTTEQDKLAALGWRRS
jgi:chromosome segregation ATPase